MVLVLESPSDSPSPVDMRWWQQGFEQRSQARCSEL